MNGKVRCPSLPEQPEGVAQETASAKVSFDRLVVGEQRRRSAGVQQQNRLFNRPATLAAVGEKSREHLAGVNRVQQNAFGMSHQYNRIKTCLCRVAVLLANEFIEDLERRL